MTAAVLAAKERLIRAALRVLAAEHQPADYAAVPCPNPKCPVPPMSGGSS